MFKARIDKEEVANLPLKAFSGTTYVIESEEDYKQMEPQILNNQILGFDTETKPSFKKGKTNKMALVQLANDKEAFLIRTINMPLPQSLIDLFKNNNILKIGVALNDDLRSLAKISHFSPEGFIDLQKYVKKYNIEDNGLKKLTANILNFRISKRQQLSNWEAQQLSEAQINYAATDAWVCYKMYKKLTAIPPFNLP
jgi:ribonuclease D